ncbi:MAG: hypothetical protein H0W68_01350 [Gemmatimonadaceae bacterium]|nr:hypothetical protein [Gemmatimonadaceae bacterium]
MARPRTVDNFVEMTRLSEETLQGPGGRPEDGRVLVPALEQLVLRAFGNELAGDPNHASLESAAQQAATAAHESHVPIAVLLSKFRKAWDAIGDGVAHAGGDENRFFEEALMLLLRYYFGTPSSVPVQMAETR